MWNQWVTVGIPARRLVIERMELCQFSILELKFTAETVEFLVERHHILSDARLFGCVDLAEQNMVRAGGFDGDLQRLGPARCGADMDQAGLRLICQPVPRGKGRALPSGVRTWLVGTDESHDAAHRHWPARARGA